MESMTSFKMADEISGYPTTIRVLCLFECCEPNQTRKTSQAFKIATSVENYRQTSNISRILVGNRIVDHSDVVGASPVGAAPNTSSFST